MTKYYTVVFDNDSEYPNQLQFCVVDTEAECLEGSACNLTTDIQKALNTVTLCKRGYPELNYRVVEVILKEIE